MSINLTTENLKVGDKVDITRDGKTYTMNVWHISEPGSGATRVSAGPLIHTQIRPGGYGQTFDYSTTGITVDPHVEEAPAEEVEEDRDPDPTPEGPRVWTSAELAAAFKDATPVHGGRDGRSVERNVTLHEEADGTKTVAALSVMHHKEAKVLMANVKIVKHEPRTGPFSAVTWIPFEKTHNRRLPNTPCPRYSAKLLAAADTAALDLLTEEPDWLDNLDLGPYSGSL
jgi:hypothetical protein